MSRVALKDTIHVRPTLFVDPRDFGMPFQGEWNPLEFLPRALPSATMVQACGLFDPYFSRMILLRQRRYVVSVQAYGSD